MRALVAGVAVAVLVGGCSEAVAGQAVEAKLFDPCTELSDEALRAAGVDPASKSDLVQYPEWHMCAWGDAVDENRNLSVFSTEWQLADFRVNPTRTGFLEVSVDGRDGLQYMEVNRATRSCAIGFDTARGSIHVEASWILNPPNDPCKFALEEAHILLPYLPN